MPVQNYEVLYCYQVLEIFDLTETHAGATLSDFKSNRAKWPRPAHAGATPHFWGVGNFAEGYRKFRPPASVPSHQ